MFGLVLLAVGLYGAFRPYQLARFGEQLDAIGSKRSLGEVEPADWNVFFTRIVSVALSVFGSGVLLFAFAGLY